MLVGVEVDKEVVDLVQHLGRARVAAVDLVDDHDGDEPQRQRLGEHEAGLGQRPLGGVDEQHDAVDHAQRALHLAAEVGVAGRVDDVDLDVVAGLCGVADGRVLGHDRDPLLALQVHGVHDPLGDGLVGGERAALLEEGVDEGGLAVVDVGDDGDVAEGGHGAGGSQSAKLARRRDADADAGCVRHENGARATGRLPRRRRGGAVRQRGGDFGAGEAVRRGVCSGRHLHRCHAHHAQPQRRSGAASQGGRRARADDAHTSDRGGPSPPAPAVTGPAAGHLAARLRRRRDGLADGVDPLSNESLRDAADG